MHHNNTRSGANSALISSKKYRHSHHRLSCPVTMKVGFAVASAKEGEVLVARFGYHLKSGHWKLEAAIHFLSGGGGSITSWYVAFACHSAFGVTQ